MKKDYGLKINKLIIVGENKQDAILEFKLGLNVIAGASDTGKTFVFQAVNYMFGGSDTPKEIEEAQGYDEIYLEIEDFKENTYTVRRNINDGKMFIYECAYIDKDKVSPSNIKEKHDKNNENNISTFLLGLCECKYKDVVKNNKGNTKSFTFRDFAKISMLGEEKIISEKSIILGKFGDTGDKNSFKTIITGLEDKGIQSNEEKKINNIKIDAQIEMLDNLISSYSEELEHTLSYGYKENTNEIEALIENIESNINLKKEKLKEADKKRQILFRESSELDNGITYNNELIKKFTLLKDNYLTDLKRIEFIDDANYYINQLDDVKCPICYSDMEKCNVEIELISEALYTEKRKLKKNIFDIDEAIKGIECKNYQLIETKEFTINVIDKITNEMNIELKPLLNLKVNELNDLLNTRDEINKQNFIKKKLDEAKELKSKLAQNKEGVNRDKVELQKINDTNIKDLSLKVSSLLKEWKLFDNAIVNIDLKTHDLTINGKKKSSFGKGYRAIINSAFAIAIMNYNIERGLPHPKVVILDSPLITFKEKDSGEDKISDVVKTSFYNYLYQNFKNKQIIVLENAEPDNILCEKIQYYHFTKNVSYGRYGFFPVFI